MNAALVATHAAMAATADAALVAGRFRRPGEGRVELVAGGRPWFPPAGPAIGGELPVLFPPGARGELVTPDAFEAMIASLPIWVACTGSDDPLWASDPAGSYTVRGSFDDYVAHLAGGFAWLVVAEPVPAAELEEELAGLAVRVPSLRKRESSEQHRVELARAEARYRELGRARATGMWRVRVLVGGEDAAVARSAAALLCSAGDLDELPYALVPVPEVTGFADAAGKPWESAGGTAPFLASSELVAALCRPPTRELPGIRLAEVPSFDVTPELSGPGVLLGDVLDEAGRPAGPFLVPEATLNRHAFVCGATGSGKSQTMRTLLEGLTREAGIPWLVIEPAKAEYARMAGRLGAEAPVAVLRPGDPEAPPAALNPLEPEPGFPLQSHADLLRALFLAAFDANEPFPQVLSRALTTVYTDAGWDLVTGEPRPACKPKLYRSEPDVPATGRYPSLGDLQRAASNVVARIGYGKEITADVRGFVDVRMGSLREGTPGRFFEGGHPLDVAGLLAGNVVLELEDITHDQDKAFLIGAVLIRIVEHLRVRAAREGAPGGLRHVTVVEEAHRLLRNAEEGPAAAAVELFASLLAEIRAYGEGVVVVEQIPAKILPDVVKNSALKIMHRLPAADDRDVVGGTMNLSEAQSEQVVAFAPGVAAVGVDGMDRPVRLRVPDREHAETGGGPHRLVPLAAARSPLCDADCAVSPCTLRTISTQAHRAGEALTVAWTEFVVLSVLTGEPPPSPATAVRAALATMTDRDRRCALVSAVTRAVDARGTDLRAWVDRGDLAAHLLTALEFLLDGGKDDADWLRWTVGCFRWDVIRGELQDAGEQEVHPHTADWADLGIDLPGPTRADQLAQLRADPSYGEGADLLVLGDPDRSGLAGALRELCGGEAEHAVRRAVWLSCATPVRQQFALLVAEMLAEYRKGF